MGIALPLSLSLSLLSIFLCTVIGVDDTTYWSKVATEDSIAELLDHQISERIVGGYDVGIPNQYPWVVYFSYSCIGYGQTVFNCGGVAIQNNVVITAAHCWLTTTQCQNGVKATIGVGKYKEVPSQTVLVINRTAYPGYILHSSVNTTYLNDIAVLKLKDVLAINVFPVLTYTRAVVGQSVIASGWGKPFFEATFTPSILQLVNLTILANSVCNATMAIGQKGSIYNATTQLCAGSGNGQRKDTCKYDAGGPLFAPTNCCPFPGTILYGLISYGAKIGTNPPTDGSCGYANASAYTDVSAYISFINSTIASWKFSNNINTPSCCACDSSTGDVGRVVSCTVPPPSPTSVPSPTPITSAVGSLLTPLFYVIVALAAILF